jgi:TetR/AcrR family transcriptional regulator, cholesterol catabolism regulator
LVFSVGERTGAIAAIPQPSGAPPSSTRKREREILDAAARIFHRHGYANSSVQEIADAVGLLKGSLYYYIDSKEDLLWRAIENVHEDWSKILDEAGSLDADPLEQIHTFIKLHVEWYLASVKEITVFFREWQHLSGERLKTITSRRRQYGEVVHNLVADAQRRGYVAKDLDVTYATRYVLAAVNAVPDWYRPSANSGEIAQAYADMTVRLLAAPSKRKN